VKKKQGVYGISSLPRDYWLRGKGEVSAPAPGRETTPSLRRSTNGLVSPELGRDVGKRRRGRRGRRGRRERRESANSINSHDWDGMGLRCDVNGCAVDICTCKSGTCVRSVENPAQASKQDARAQVGILGGERGRHTLHTRCRQEPGIPLDY
jgi:hypothetical protein